MLLLRSACRQLLRPRRDQASSAPHSREPLLVRQQDLNTATRLVSAMERGCRDTQTCRQAGAHRIPTLTPDRIHRELHFPDQLSHPPPAGAPVALVVPWVTARAGEIPCDNLGLGRPREIHTDPRSS